MADLTRGRIKQLGPDANGCYVQLMDADAVPKDGLFQLRLAHENYNTIFSLLLLAATNGYPVTIRADYPITPNERAVIAWIKVDW